MGNNTHADQHRDYESLHRARGSSSGQIVVRAPDYILTNRHWCENLTDRRTRREKLFSPDFSWETPHWITVEQ
jgi:cyclopropane fatty-acyl-phospholipid synthase-like methyltransferase